MSAPTFNKYRSTTIYGNLSVRDLTNSAGTSVLEVASVDLSGNFLSRGNSTFTKKVVCDALLADINANNILTTKEYVDTAVSTGGSVSLSGTNAFTGNNSYNVNFPTSTLPTSTSITTDSIVNKGMNDTLYSSKTNEVKTNTANAFTSTNAFNNSFPTAPFDTIMNPVYYSSSSICNKYYNDEFYAPKLNTPNITTNNTFTATNTFNGATNQNGTANFSGFANFNTNFPTSTLPTSTSITTDSIVNKGMNDTLYSSKTNEVKTNTVNTFTDNNNFNDHTNFNTTVAFYSSLSQDSIVLPSGTTNKFIYTSFKEGVEFGKGFSQNGSDTNYLDNLTLGGVYTSNNLVLAYDTGIVQTGSATNSLTNLTIDGTSLTLGATNTTIINSSGITQNDTSAINTLKGETTFDNDVNFNKEVFQPTFLINQDRTLPSGKQNKFIATNFLEAVNFNGITQISGTTTNTLNNLTIDGGIITQINNTSTNSLNNLTIATNLTLTNGSITQSAGSTTNTLKNLQVDTISTIPEILTNITQSYLSLKMKNYIFHSRTATNASTITLSTNTYIDDGQYLYVRKINTGSYTLTLTAGTSTTFLNLSNASVSSIALTGLTGVSFIYDKTNTRWIQLT